MLVWPGVRCGQYRRRRGGEGQESWMCDFSSSSYVVHAAQALAGINKKKKKKKAHKGQHLGDRLRKQVRLEALLFGVCDPCPLFSPLFSRLMYIIYISIGSTVIIIVKYRVFCRAGLGFPLS